MQDKLQELTQRLYNEGLSKGKAEGEAIAAKAQQEAKALIEQAKQEAQSIIDAANKKAAEIKDKADSDIKMAASQCIQATKKDIENLIVKELCQSKISEALDSEAYIKEVIRAVSQGFCSKEDGDINLVLPDKLQKELEPWINTELGKILGKGVTAQFGKKVGGGFTIGPKDGSYFISFTDESFSSLIAAYLRPVTRKILFGE